MTDRQPGIVSAWRCVFPLSRVRTSGARLVQRGVVGMTQFSQVVAGWTPLNTEDLVGFAQRPGMDSAALDGLGHAVSDSVCTPCRPGAVGTLVSMGNLKPQWPAYGLPNLGLQLQLHMGQVGGYDHVGNGCVRRDPPNKTPGSEAGLSGRLG